MKKRQKKKALKEKQTPSSKPRVKYLIPVVLLFLIPLQALTSIIWKSATVEEGVHLAAGAYYWKNLDFEPFPGYLPAFRMWMSLPLVMSGINIPNAKPACNDIFPFAYGADFLYTVNDADTVLFTGRVMGVILALLLGIYIFLFSKDIFGWHAAVLALFIYGFSPNILAHARLATSDLPLTAFFFITLYYFRKAVVTDQYRFAFLACIFAFLTISTKYSGLLIFPVLLFYVIILYIIERLQGVEKEKKSPLSVNISAGRSLKTLVIILIVSVFMINAAYGFKGIFGNLKNYHLSLSQQKEEIESSFFKKISRVPLLSSIPLPLPLFYLRGLDIAVYNDRDARHPNWYLGKLYQNNEHWWHYYFSAMALKLPIPMLIAIFITAVGSIVTVKNHPARLKLFLFLLMPPGIFFLFYSFIVHSQIGLRLILPAFPFFFTATGFLVPAAFKKRHRPQIGLAVILMIWYFFSSVQIYPHYLSYFNGLAGGPKKGIEFFADSNLDWGQDLKGLKRYMNKKDMKKINLVYYGPYGSPELKYYDIAVNDPKLNPRVPWAISATWRYYADVEPIKSTVPFPFKKQAPDEMIGYSIYVYYP